MSVATAQELRNEAREELNKAIAARDEGGDGWQEKYKGHFAEYQRKVTAAEDATQTEDELAKALEDIEKADPNDGRNPTDAEKVKTVDSDKATKGIKLADGRVVQYADDKTEGWIKGYPASVQHPDIVWRLEEKHAAAAEQERDAFAKYVRYGMRSLDGDERKALGRLKDPDRSKALQEDTDTEGGFLVPTDQRSELVLARGVPAGVSRTISRVLTTSRDGGTIPASTDDVTWASVAEEASFTEDDPTFSQVAFTIRKIGRLNKVSEELLEDSAVNIPALLTLLFTNGLGRYEDQQSIEGDGTTEPLGLRTTGAAQGNVADITNLLTLAGVTAAEVIDAFYELPAQWRAGATWYITSGFMGTLAQIGATAAGIHTFQELMNSEPTPRLLGRPVVMFDGTGWDDGTLAITADAEVGAFGDFSHYWFIDRVGMSITRLNERFADTDQVGFKARKRYDSLFVENGAFRILKAAAS